LRRGAHRRGGSPTRPRGRRNTAAHPTRGDTGGSGTRLYDGNGDTLKAKVHITLKGGVLDPQGKAIQTALQHLGFDGVDEVRQGKYIELELADTDPVKAKARVAAMCEKLLANMIIENYSVEVEGAA
jgi:phosphoribosylformylglycinamidine synthase PurS subunit